MSDALLIAGWVGCVFLFVGVLATIWFIAAVTVMEHRDRRGRAHRAEDRAAKLAERTDQQFAWTVDSIEREWGLMDADELAARRRRNGRELPVRNGRRWT